MSSSQLISLFSEPQKPSRNSYSVAVSALFHVVMFGPLMLGFMPHPRINEPRLPERRSVRLLDLQSPEAQMQAAMSAIPYPSHGALANPSASDGNAAPAPAAPPRAPQKTPTHQTLLQPDVSPNVMLPQDVQLPMVVMRASIEIPAVKITPAPIKNDTAADVRTSLDPPNQELRPSDVSISASQIATENQPVQPSTTSPLAAQQPAPKQEVPETGSTAQQQPNPANVTSISDVHMAEGTVALPRAIQTPSASSSGTSPFGWSEQSSLEGTGTNTTPGQGSGPVSGAGGPSQGQVSAAGPGQLAGSATGSGAQHSSTRITKPKNGQFGMVVVGSTLEESYPATAGLWSGRLAYSVYLHLGTTRNWIMQYSLPRVEEAVGKGSKSSLEAPWPYDIERPDLAPGDINADALLVHGTVNKEGRFEDLAVVFPPQFAQAKFVLDSLEQWRFKPAVLQGQATSVEVLLIVPDDQP